MKKIIIGVVFLLFTIQSNAQYKVYCWENFENGVFPKSLKRMHDTNEKNVVVVSYDFIKKDPNYRKILDGIARTECGKYGLLFSIPKAEVEKKPNGVFLSLVSENILDRKILKNAGKAIIQADVYIPSDESNKPSTSIPGIAVLGVGGANPNDFAKWALYRVGISPRYGVFFSFIDAVRQEAPLVFNEEKIENLKLQIPGWHRLQLVFQGTDTIGCYIDGVKTTFSPIKEGSVNTLRMGLMISSSSQADKICIIDNLSIQVTDENLELPTSPWVITDPANLAKMKLSPIYQKPDFIESKLQWFLTPEDAVQYNKDKKMPYLILFYSPLAKLHKPLETMINSDPEFQKYLRQFVLTRLDVNQLNGGKVAEFYGVFKVPCFMLLDNYGNKKTSLIYKANMPCSEISQAIQAGMN